MNVMRETKNFPLCSDLQSIVFFALFLVIIIIIIILLLLLITTTTTIIIIIIREIWLDSCDPWLLVTRSKGIFPVEFQLYKEL